MYKYIMLLIITMFCIPVGAQKNKEKAAINTVITTFFEGLHNGDSTLVSKTLHRDVKIQTTYTNKEGEKILLNQSKQKLLLGIASKKKTDIYLEKLLSYTIEVDGNLASVWTPYEFYLNTKFSHCGANSFQLFNNNGSWEIIYLVDMRRREFCNVSEVKK